MICRVWRGWTKKDNASAYERIVRGEVIPGIEARRIPGFRCIDLVRRERENDVEFMTLMWFDELDSGKAFMGQDYGAAHVPARPKRCSRTSTGARRTTRFSTAGTAAVALPQRRSNLIGTPEPMSIEAVPAPRTASMPASGRGPTPRDRHRDGGTGLHEYRRCLAPAPSAWPSHRGLHSHCTAGRAYPHLPRFVHADPLSCAVGWPGHLGHGAGGCSASYTGAVAWEHPPRLGDEFGHLVEVNLAEPDQDRQVVDVVPFATRCSRRQTGTGWPSPRRPEQVLSVNGTPI